MVSKCFSLIRGRVMRVTKLDGCGAPVPGAASVVVSKGFVSIALTANTDEGTAISVQNANGDNCISDTPAPKFTGFGVEIDFCGVDPDLYALVSGQQPVKDGADVSIGFSVDSDVDLDAVGFALEIWSTVPGQACGDTGLPNYGYILVPFIKGGTLGDFTVANDAVNFVLTGGQSKDGSTWGVGPYAVMLDEDDTPGPLLAPVGDHNHLKVFVTQVAPPVDECGGQALGTPATGATAGAPGTLTPTNTYAPQDLASIGSLTATPLTAWTEGQYIVLGDGSDAHWTGTAWAAGVAPGDS